MRAFQLLFTFIRRAQGKPLPKVVALDDSSQGNSKGLNEFFETEFIAKSSEL